MDKKKRIGVFGGTFDPIHNGHLGAADFIVDKEDLDEMLMVVANDPYQKTGTLIRPHGNVSMSGFRKVSPPELRYEWTRLGIAKHKNLVASRIEIDRGGPSLTVETLRELHKDNSDAELFLLLGADAAAGIEHWQEWEGVAELATLIVVSRPGIAKPKLSGVWRVRYYDIPGVDVSSSEINDLLDQGLSIDHLVPAGVAEAVRRARQPAQPDTLGNDSGLDRGIELDG